MYDMKMKASREIACSPCVTSEEENYPCVYLDVPKGMAKVLRGLGVGDEVSVTLKAKIKGLTLRDPETSYNGGAGSIDLEVGMADIKAASGVFGDLTESDDE